MAESTGGRRTRVRPVVEAVEEKVWVDATYKRSDGSKKNANSEKVLQIRKFVSEPAYVKVSAGLTKNMQDFEFLRIDVSVTLPCYPEEVDAALEEAADKASVFVNDELERWLEAEGK